MKKFLLICILLTSISLAQSFKDSLNWNSFSADKNKLSSLFSKQFSTYNLNSSLLAKYEFNYLRFGINENFISTIIKSLKQKSIKDENLFSFFSDYKMLDNVRFGLSVNSSKYVGDKNIVLNNSSSSNILFYSIYNPHENINLVPFGGYTKNNLLGLEDKGYSYGVEINSEDFQVEDFNLTARMKYMDENISPRKNTDRFFLLRIRNEFENNITNDLFSNFSESRKDLYFNTDSITAQHFNIEKNIQSRTERKTIFSDRLKYLPSNSDFQFDIFGGISNRLIDRNTKYVYAQSIRQSDFDYKIEELKIDFASTINYRTNSSDGFLRLSYSEKEEKYNAKNIYGANQLYFEKRKELEFQKNNKSSITNLAAAFNLKLSAKDLFSFSIFHRKLVYDTQSKLNYDDRDELLTIAQITYKRQFNYLWNLFAGIEGSQNKIVYIFAERSSNNNIARVLKFNSGVNFSGSRVTSTTIAEVSANYTVYDFEDLNPNYKSFSFRQFSIKDSTALKINKKISARFFGYIKLSEQAELNWNKFTSRPFRTIQEEYYEPKIELRNKGLILSTGLRFYIITNFRYGNEFKKQTDSYYKSVGPVSEINYFITDRLQIKSTGYYEFISNEKEINREQVNLLFTVNWNF
jgi:hypothetical protein